MARLCAAAVLLATGASGDRASFLAQHNSSYGYGMPDFESFVHGELGNRLQGDVYLDYAASGLYTDSQIDAHAADLKQNLYGNPHSLSSSARRSSASVDQARDQVLRFLSAPPSQYEVVFTRSCTDSLRLIADMFPWSAAGSEYRYLLQNHNSVLGIRDVARDFNASVGVVWREDVDAWLDGLASQEEAEEGPLSLFAYPAEENFAGQIFPLRWAAKIGGRNGKLRNWRVLLDAAKFTASHPLNLTEAQADFVTLSFYKLFGYPTGVGALVLRQDAAFELKKHYWGGGSVAIAGAGRTNSDDLKVFKGRIAERFEDGTVAFLGIAALRHGFDALERVGGMAAIEKHTSALASELHRRLRDLRHSHGGPVIAMYSPDADRRVEDDCSLVQGPIVNFNVLDADGSLLSHIDVMAAAAEAGIHIRAGMHCNPGAATTILGLPPEAIRDAAEDTSFQGCGNGPAFVKCRASQVHAIRDDACNRVYTGPATSRAEPVVKPDFLDTLGGLEPELQMPFGSVRVSVGYLSTYDDIEQLVEFLSRKYRQ